MGPGGPPGLQNRVCPDKSGRVGSTPTYSRFLPNKDVSVKNAILLLEDDLTARDLMLKVINSALSDLEQNVYIAENGNDALNLIKSHGENIILFTTDVIHPGIDTLELIKAAKMKNPQIKIMLITGSVTVEEEYGSQADFILTKPFTNETFADLLRLAFIQNK